MRESKHAPAHIARATTARSRSILALGLAGLVMAGCTGTSHEPAAQQNGQQPAQQQGSATLATGSDTIPANATNVLQSVQVQVAPNGSVGTVDSTAIATAGDASTGTTVTNQWKGSDVAGDLPVRVQASYRLRDANGRVTRTGTNLSELEGHSGRIEVDLVVQNLTAKPTDVTVDVGGRSRTRRMMVGVPLSVVASTSMPGVSASSVVTSQASSTGRSTDGVLSQGSKGEAVVQWATLLAPPRTGGSSTLHLVVDAKDFSAPTFDLSVQPGLVTDASLGTLLDSTMAPTGSRELDLQRQTISLVGQVNQVLGQASTSVDTMRDNLASTSRTLGQRTVQDMGQSAQRIAQSMKSLDGQLTALKGTIAGSMDQTNQVVLQSLQQTVTLTDQMLGDTSSTPVAPRVSGSGCQLASTPSTRATSVYGNLMQVVGALDAYSRLAEGCRAQVRGQIAAMIGPSDPTAAQACPDPAHVTDTTPLSVTCSMHLAREHFDTTVAEQLQHDGQAALDALQPELMARASSGTDAVSADVDALDEKAAALAATDHGTAAVGAVGERLDRLGTDLDVVDQQRRTINDQARAGQAQATAMEEQNRLAARQLCEVPAVAAAPAVTVTATTQARHDNGLHQEGAPAAAATPDASQGQGSASPSATPSATGTASASATASTSPSGTPGATGTATPSPQTPSASGTPSTSPTPSTSASPTAEPTTSQTAEPSTPAQDPTTAPATQAPTGVDADRLLGVRALLVDTACDDRTPLERPAGHPKSLATLLGEQTARWGAVADQSADRDADGNQTPLATALATVHADVADAQKALDAVRKGDGADAAAQAAATKELDAALARLKDDRSELVSRMKALGAQQATLATDVSDAFATAGANGRTTVDGAMDLAVRQTSATGQASGEALDAMFAAAANGLGSESVGLGERAAAQVADQKAQVSKATEQTRTQVSQQLSGGLQQIAQTVGSSTRDTQAANVQLATDMKSVLLDLGTAKVGGKGLLGAMATSADRAASTSGTLAKASTKVTDYGNLRNQDVVALLTEQAQDRASAATLEELPAFRIVVPASARHRTVYTFHVGVK